MATSPDSLRRTWRAAITAAVVILASGAFPGHSADADEAADARFFDRIARRDFQRGRYESALAHFLSSQRAAPNPRTVFNIALTAKLAGDEPTALSFFVEYLAAAPGDDPDRRHRAEDAVAELSQRVPTVQVTSDPPGARIYTDRAPLGSRGLTPRLVPVEAGAHQVIVELAGYRRAEAVVEVEEGRQASVHFDMVPVTGILHVVTRPEEAEVVVLRAGETVARGDAPLVVELPIGTYRARAVAPGHAPDVTNVTVEEARTSQARLEPRPRDRLTGRLLVSVSNDARAEVRVDGRWMGYAPLSIPRVLAGEREVEVKAAGYLDWAGRVRVPAQGAVHLPVELSSVGE